MPKCCSTAPLTSASTSSRVRPVATHPGATINPRGRWSQNAPLSASSPAQIAARSGPVHSYTPFTGCFPLRIRGEMRAFQVLGSR